MSLTRTIWAKVNAGNSLSTDESNTGQKWIDGKTIYRKIVSLGALPNATTKSVLHGISGATLFITITGFAKQGSTYLPLPYAKSTWGSSEIELYISGNYVVVDTGTVDRTGFTVSYAILEYIK